jgi:hypothetical protein
VKIPDFISPVLAWRVWQLDAAGLRSLNGEAWTPGRPLVAGCRVAGAHRTARLPHDAPQMRCTCGVYGSKTLHHLRSTQYWLYGSVHGEVLIWGSVVEHEQGFRAQFAYPRTLHLRMSHSTDRLLRAVMFGVGLEREARSHFGSWRVRQIDSRDKIGRDHGTPSHRVGQSFLAART